MPKFSFSHARKFQFPGRVPGSVAGAGLAAMILASCGPPAGGGNAASIGLVLAKARAGPALADDVHSKRQPGRKWRTLAGFTGVCNTRLSRALTSAFMSVH